MKCAQQIRALRKKENLTQVRLAEKLGFCSPALIAMWESGARAPRSDVLPELAKALGCSVDELFSTGEK